MRTYLPTIMCAFTLAMGASAQDTDATRLTDANASVAAAAQQAAADPLRPAFHVMPQAYWNNDPNGPVYFDGEYHLFYQHNPFGREWGNMSWGHVVSKDLVTWEHLPIALVPGSTYDAEGIFSGCCVIDDQGVPTIVYTGVDPEVQCIARSHDRLRTWDKFAGNPVIPKRPQDNLQGFRDPFVWKESDLWFMLLGSGINGEGGTALLYSSPDLETWTYMHPLCVGFGMNWECPNFFPLKDKHVLVVSPHAKVRYAIGDYKDHRFTPGEWHLMDWGNFYAPNTLTDPAGRQIVWGWVQGAGAPDAPWNNSISLPRLVTLGEGGRLVQQPLPELQQLREEQLAHVTSNVTKESPNLLDGVRGNQLEIALDLNPGNLGGLRLEVLGHADGAGGFPIVYDNRSLVLRVGDIVAPLQPQADGTIRLHVFVDHSVIEVFANGRECVTAIAHPADQHGGLKLAIEADGPQQAGLVQSLDVWRLGTIWK